MVKEDILRLLSEISERIKVETIKDEIKVAHPFISKALEELERDGLINIQEKFISLTELGQEKAKTILEKHLVLEDYFKKTKSTIDAHIAAYILEHYVSRKVIDNIKKLSTLKKEGVPLTKFKLNKEGLITEINVSDYKLFERAVSMGLFPGEKIRVISEISHGIVLKLTNKKIALDRSVAERIKALEYEEI